MDKIAYYKEQIYKEASAALVGAGVAGLAAANGVRVFTKNSRAVKKSTIQALKKAKKEMLDKRTSEVLKTYGNNKLKARQQLLPKVVDRDINRLMTEQYGDMYKKYRRHI